MSRTQVEQIGTDSAPTENGGKYRFLPAGFMFCGWVLLFLFTGKISYDSEFPTNNNGDNTSIFYSQTSSGAFWFFWVILLVTLIAIITTVFRKFSVASRFATMTIVLMFFYFMLTADQLQPCLKSSYREGRSRACNINAVGAAGGITTLIGAVLGAILLSTSNY
eukprot:Opistho-2@58072